MREGHCVRLYNTIVLTGAQLTRQPPALTTNSLASVGSVAIESTAMASLSGDMSTVIGNNAYSDI